MVLKRIFTISMVAISCAALAQTAPVTPVQPDRAAATPNIVILRGKVPTKVPVAGNVKLIAAYRNRPTPAAIAFFLDGKEIGRATERPYSMEWDSSSAGDGDHELKWSALAADGNEIVSGSLILVKGDGAASSASAPSFAAYRNNKYGVSFDYPSSWSVRDESDSAPKDWAGRCWLVASTEPLDSAQNVLNVKHRLLHLSHTADSYAREVKFVSDWNRSEVAGHPAFVTTDGSEASRRVIHRAIVVNGRSLWMLNLIDTAGKPAAESKAIFSRVLQTLKFEDYSRQTGNRVIIETVHNVCSVDCLHI